MRRALVLPWVLLAGALSLAAGEDTVPTWLDTIAPVVEVSPKEKYHARLFQVELRANEPGNIWFALDDPERTKQYKNPITVVKKGRAVVYFYAEDYVGNRSPLDSAVYVLDSRAPILSIAPEPGRYREPVTVVVTVDEPVRLYRHTDPKGKERVAFRDSFVVAERFEGYVSAVDSAGNRTTSRALSYIVDTSSVFVAIEPDGGVYSEPTSVSFRTRGKVEVHYSLDPLAPSDWFKAYTKPIELPHGLTLIRYFGRTDHGRESAMRKATFVIDTIAPRIRVTHLRGARSDTVVLSTKEKAEIRYSLQETGTIDEESVYTTPLVFPHRGRGYVRAVATDKAGNVSELTTWEYKFDRRPPVVTAQQRPGTYTKPFSLTLKTSEPARIFYTLDGSEPTMSSLLYKDGIQISRPGTTMVRCFGVDEAGNRSEELSVTYELDIEAPEVKVRIDGNVGENTFTVTLRTGEDSRIHYEIGDRTPTTASPVYKGPIDMRSGQTLRYFAVDAAGNRSEIYVMDDLKRPMANISPEGGVYNKRVKVRFETNMPSSVHYRILPDTTWRRVLDTLVLGTQGLHTLEYYSETPEGLRSPIRRNEYLLDWTPPHAEVSVRKGVGDSVSVFIECSENAAIYYTLDGTSPLFSQTTRMAGNKFLQSKDRISLARSRETKLAFYTEDVAGNQSSVTVMDVFKPRVVPSVPSGKDRRYDRILSVSLNTYDERSQIYYERHGKHPTMESPVFDEPLTLLSSDTIVAFVVDASGYRGEIDTFVYVIDLPPTPFFLASPDTVDIGAPVTFDASRTLDHETALSRLTFRWDFDGDGTAETTREGESTASYSFRESGWYTVTLTVEDEGGRKSTAERRIMVRGYCPKDMMFVAMENGHSFCIDRYEWPNEPGGKPQTGVSWVQAKMHCLDAGKRLCRRSEWEFACDGGRGRTYPYGGSYEGGRCPTEGEEVYRAGQFDRCGEGFGLHDMVGNVWEWVEDGSGFRPLLAGGTLRSGEAAHCRLFSDANMVAHSKDAGFRCCK